MNYSIVRPCGIFGDKPVESILMNNAAWVMRRTPLFLLAGNGGEVFQPVHVRDMAKLMGDLGKSKDTTGEEMDACGPDAPTALELFRRLNGSVGGRGFVVPSGLPTRVIGAMTKPIDWLTGDVLLDTDDLDLLSSGLTTANEPSDPLIKGRRSLFQWIDEVKDELGQEYVSSIQRYYKTK
jgi:NADH dehydrogenase